jgi:hypothetical protein
MPQYRGQLWAYEELVWAPQLFQHSKIWKTQRLKIIGGRCESRPRSLTTETPALRWHVIASKRLANAHPECMTIPALGDIGSQIDVVLLT